MQTLKTLSLALMLSLWAFSTAAFADAPENRGVIRQVNLEQGWIVIDTQRVMLTAKTKIRNLALGGSHRGALKVNTPVRFSTGEGFELERIWLYPTDPEARALLGYGTSAEEGY